MDDNYNLKVADFGFATYVAEKANHSKLRLLNSYRGTKTYMAPEIRKQMWYDGRQVDTFSTGVILFILVVGIFPFSAAKDSDYFYELLNEDQDKYWSTVGGDDLTPEFKDLMIKMLSANPENRPTIEELKAHAWVNGSQQINKSSMIYEELIKEPIKLNEIE